MLVRAAVAALVAAGYDMSVHDGIRSSVRHSTDVGEVVAGLRNASDETVLVCSDRRRVGSIWLVDGRVESHSAELTPILEQALRARGPRGIVSGVSRRHPRTSSSRAGPSKEKYA